MAIKKYRKTAQLYNKDGTDTNNGYIADNYLRPYDGNVGSGSSNHTISEYIDISSFSQLTLSGLGTSSATANSFYDENKTLLSYFLVDEGPKTVNVPQNAKYIRLTVYKPRQDTEMLNAGSTALDYEPYGVVPIDWFYRKYGTETDTFSTLPHEVIGDGQPISSYTIKGNMTQSGTGTTTVPSKNVTVSNLESGTNYAMFSKTDFPDVAVGDTISIVVGGTTYSQKVKKIDTNYVYIENREV